MNIEHIALNVPDPAAAAEWYGRHLGMRVVRSGDGPAHARFVADKAGRVVLELYHQEKAGVPDYFAMDPMVLHIAFSTADVKGSRERLLAGGATAIGEPTVAANGDELALLRDPWGVTVQLVKRARALLEAE